ncbi:MAG: hypothetical protein K2J84_08345 [Bacteroidaceae bacterium]|nr:hypothetical protein [Bacteroidaceae bacterium]
MDFLIPTEAPRKRDAPTSERPSFFIRHSALPLPTSLAYLSTSQQSSFRHRVIAFGKYPSKTTSKSESGTSVSRSRGHRPTDVPDSDFEALTAPIKQSMMMTIIRSWA